MVSKVFGGFDLFNGVERGFSGVLGKIFEKNQGTWN